MWKQNTPRKGYPKWGPTSNFLMEKYEREQQEHFPHEGQGYKRRRSPVYCRKPWTMAENTWDRMHEPYLQGYPQHNNPEITDVGNCRTSLIRGVYTEGQRQATDSGQ
jgi:hypothetical protein